ncbi:hypothetical protein PRUB_b0682 [Pseudoalteromonas rubra]|uniref:Uncharacterized protein n=2 Tax=Pseudoalteromonas rubra TaxID=43658 RepID=A0A8T0C0M1_9GAMM|nr:hypothetical protein PRUB_b0682 [Pseudoalteromonas rubra]
MVGDIITFIPIELTPLRVAQVWKSPASNGIKIAWSKVDDAKYYKLSYTVKNPNGSEVSHSVVVTGLYHTLSSDTNSYTNITVQACHDYGCSTMQVAQEKAQQPLTIQSFYGGASQAGSNGVVTLHWQTSGATSVSISQTVNGRIVSTKHGLSPNTGSYTVRPTPFTSYTLTAHQFEGQTAKRTINIASAYHQPERKPGKKQPAYQQPFHEKGYDIVQRTLVRHVDSLYFSTRDYKLYRFDIGDNNRIQPEPTWVLETDGLIANKPIIEGDHLFYTASYSAKKQLNGENHKKENKGQVCSVNIARGITTPAPECRQFEFNVVAGPVMVRTPERTVSNLFRLFSAAPADEAAEGLYVFERNGTLSVIDPYDLKRNIVRRQIPNGDSGNGILATPEVFLSGNGSNVNQIVVKQEGKIMGVQVPTSSEVPSRVSVAARSMMQSLGLSERAEPEPVKPLEVIWEKEL